MGVVAMRPPSARLRRVPFEGRLTMERTMRRRRPAERSLGFLLCLPVLLALLSPALARGEPGEGGNELLIIAKGRAAFHLYCRSCHGASGKGDGSVAELLKIPPTDLTRLSAGHDGEFPFDEVYKIVDGREVPGHGSRDMPVWGNAFQDTEETEDEMVVKEKIIELVYFVKSIQEPAE